MDPKIDLGKKITRRERLVKSFYAELASKNIHKKLSMIGRRKTTFHDKTRLGIKSADEAEDTEHFPFPKRSNLGARKIVRRFSFQPRDNFTENWVNRQNFFERRNEKDSTRSKSTAVFSRQQQEQFEDGASLVSTVPVEALAEVFLPFQSTPKILVDCVVVAKDSGQTEIQPCIHCSCLADRTHMKDFTCPINELMARDIDQVMRKKSKKTH